MTRDQVTCLCEAILLAGAVAHHDIISKADIAEASAEAERITARLKCEWCNGAGYGTHSAGVDVCPRCNGSGERSKP